jgi:hypothetical protein
MFRSIVVSTSLLLTLPTVATSASRYRVTVDSTWTRTHTPPPSFDRVAVLPAALVGTPDDATAIVVADRWAALTPGLARHVIRGSVCASALAESKLGDRPVLDIVKDELGRNGRLSPATADAICGRLRLDALVLIRVDRWEDATLHAGAALVDCEGMPWWVSAGTARGPGSDSPGALVAGTDESARLMKPMPTQAAVSSGSSWSGGVRTQVLDPPQGRTKEPATRRKVEQPAPPAAPIEAAVDALVLAWAPTLPARR